MSTATYTVTGMTCEHCVSSVTEELTKVEGVRDVDVELATGAVTITSDGPIEPAKAREAINEAGFELAGS